MLLKITPNHALGTFKTQYEGVTWAKQKATLLSSLVDGI
jgi:hypothetical protein